MKQKTYQAKENEIVRKWYLIDAKDQILGRIATKAATLLRGKHKPIYTPYIDSGDMVVIINAEKVKVTGKKLQDKIYNKYSGYPSGRKMASLEVMLKRSPTKVLKLAVNRMIPKGPLGYRSRMKLKVYAGESHPHQTHKPIPVEI